MSFIVGCTSALLSCDYLVNTPQTAAPTCFSVPRLIHMLQGKIPFSGHPVDVLHILNKLKLPVLSLHLLAGCMSYCKVISYKIALQIDFSYKSGYAVSSTETRNNSH